MRSPNGFDAARKDERLYKRPLLTKSPNLHRGFYHQHCMQMQHNNTSFPLNDQHNSTNIYVHPRFYTWQYNILSCTATKHLASNPMSAQLSQVRSTPFHDACLDVVMAWCRDHRTSLSLEETTERGLRQRQTTAMFPVGSNSIQKMRLLTPPRKKEAVDRWAWYVGFTGTLVPKQYWNKRQILCS